MPMPQTWVARRREPWFVALITMVGAIAGLALLHGVNKLALGDREVLALDDEDSIATWFSSTLFAFAGVASLTAAALGAPSRALWTCVGLVFVAFSIDDAILIHERGERENQNLNRLILQPAVVAILAGALVLLGRRSRRPESTLLNLAAAGIVVALVASLWNAYYDPPYAVIVVVQAIEETSEMLVAALVLAASVRVVSSRIRVDVPASG